MTAAPPRLEEKAFADAEAQSVALAAEISRRLRRAIAARGGALLAVSGGRSPLRLFQLLAQADLPWSAVTLTLVDERWVPAADAASNERLVREHLLRGRAAAARFVPLKNSAATPEEGAAGCHDTLAGLSLPFDVVVLGMGDDGHTASLFPRTPGLEDALDPGNEALCAALHPPGAPYPRLSLTLRALLSSRWLVLPLQGAAKLAAYRRALGAGPVALMPVRALLRQTLVPIDVWIAN